MTLDPLQLLCLRAADGELSSEEEARLRAAGESPEALRGLRELVRSAHAASLPRAGVPELAPAVLAALALEEAELPLAEALAAEAGASPELAAAVLGEAGLESEALPLRAALGLVGEPDLASAVLAELGLAEDALDLAGALTEGAGEAPALADAVLSRTELADRSTLLGEALRAGLPAPGEVDLVAEIMGSLGAEDTGTEAADLVAAALAEGAGSPPSLWSGVADALDLSEASPEAPSEAEVLPLRSTPASPVAPVAPARAPRRWERWAMGSAGLAAAAALLIFLTQAETVPQPEQIAAVELAPVNDLELEDIYSEAMVQVIDGEDDAPTIIFISEPVEGELFDTEEGRL